MMASHVFPLTTKTVATIPSSCTFIIYYASLATCNKDNLPKMSNFKGMLNE